MEINIPELPSVSEGTQEAEESSIKHGQTEASPQLLRPLEAETVDGKESVVSGSQDFKNFIDFEEELKQVGIQVDENYEGKADELLSLG